MREKVFLESDDDILFFFGLVVVVVVLFVIHTSSRYIITRVPYYNPAPISSHPITSPFPIFLFIFFSFFFFGWVVEKRSLYLHQVNVPAPKACYIVMRRKPYHAKEAISMRKKPYHAESHYHAKKPYHAKKAISCETAMREAIPYESHEERKTFLQKSYTYLSISISFASLPSSRMNSLVD